MMRSEAGLGFRALCDNRRDANGLIKRRMIQVTKYVT